MDAWVFCCPTCTGFPVGEKKRPLVDPMFRRPKSLASHAAKAGEFYRDSKEEGICVLVPKRWAGWWFQIYFFMFIPTWGNDPIWLIFFSWGWFNHQLVGIFENPNGP